MEVWALCPHMLPTCALCLYSWPYHQGWSPHCQPPRWKIQLPNPTGGSHSYDHSQYLQYQVRFPGHRLWDEIHMQNIHWEGLSGDTPAIEWRKQQCGKERLKVSVGATEGLSFPVGTPELRWPFRALPKVDKAARPLNLHSGQALALVCLSGRAKAIPSERMQPRLLEHQWENQRDPIKFCTFVNNIISDSPPHPQVPH